MGESAYLVKQIAQQGRAAPGKSKHVKYLHGYPFPLLKGVGVLVGGGI
jgi:hypothetical protein